MTSNIIDLTEDSSDNEVEAISHSHQHRQKRSQRDESRASDDSNKIDSLFKERDNTKLVRDELPSISHHSSKSSTSTDAIYRINFDSILKRSNDFESSSQSSKRPRSSDIIDTGSSTSNKFNFSAPKWQPYYLLQSKGVTKYDPRSLSLSDILNIDGYVAAIKQILLINFMIDLDWLLTECPFIVSHPLLCIHGSDLKPSTTLPSNIASYRVDMGLEKYGTHHGKMAFIFTNIGIRVAIFTANFIEMDFHYMTNAVFVEDFPLIETLDTPTTSASSSSSDNHRFRDHIEKYLRSIVLYSRAGQQQFDRAIDLLRGYDYSTAQVDVIASVPGRHIKDNIDSWGHMRLRRCLESIECRGDVGIRDTRSKLVMQFSSMGTFGKDEKYLIELSQSMSLKSGSHADIQLIWPSLQNVRDSVAGYASGSSLRSTQQPGRWRPGLRRCLSIWDGSQYGREKVMPHMKCYFTYSSKGKTMPSNDTINDDVEIDWFLLTSANCSQAAWGILQKENKQLYIKSYEIGVLYHPKTIKSWTRSFSLTPCHGVLGVDDTTAIHHTSDAMIFQMQSNPSSSNHTGIPKRSILFPIPFVVPSQRYVDSHQMPWVGDIVYSEPDRFGNNNSGS